MEVAQAGRVRDEERVEAGVDGLALGNLGSRLYTSATRQHQESISGRHSFLLAAQQTPEVEYVAGRVGNDAAADGLTVLLEECLHLGNFMLPARLADGGAVAAADDEDRIVIFNHLQYVFTSFLLSSGHRWVLPFIMFSSHCRVAPSGRSYRRNVRRWAQCRHRRVSPAHACPSPAASCGCPGTSA